MVPYGSLWFLLVLVVLYSSLWYLIVPDCSFWFLMVPYGSLKFLNIPNDSPLAPLVFFGFLKVQ